MHRNARKGARYRNRAYWTVGHIAVASLVCSSVAFAQTKQGGGRAKSLVDNPDGGPPGIGLVFAPEERLDVGDEHSGAFGPNQSCANTVTADVVALDQVVYYNRLMTFLPSQMMYALRRDIVPIVGTGPTALTPGNVRLRSDKRSRPITLRVNKGDCLQVTFTNLLSPTRVNAAQPATRAASMYVDGLSLVNGIASAGTNVGANASSLALPGETRTYTWYGSDEGQFIVRSAAAMTGGQGNSGQPSHGLFGAVLVEPTGSQWYRSQLTANEMEFMTTGRDAAGNRVVNYEATYPTGHRFGGLPVARMVDPTGAIVHTDLNAVITNVGAGNYPDVAVAAPNNNGVARSRNEPFREFTIIYHDEIDMVQAFQVLETEFFAHSVRDNMAINYGTGGIGAEIISYGYNELAPGSAATHIPAGQSKECADCKYEEAFLSSWAVGDPAQVFERQPAAIPATGQATRVLYPDDPSNVFHSYMNDHVKMRLLHGSNGEHHIHHLHAHQWLYNQNGDNSGYLDSQAIGPGSGYTLDIVYNGSGNRNKTVGDSIFHCHFYPHFAQGMWALWRVHDVFEDGTRTLPDLELPGGTPIPGVLPLPHLAMAPQPTAALPGYPFFIPGTIGHRPPHPPMDTVDDGGLPRHVVTWGKVLDGHRGPFDRELLEADAIAVPETGSPAEVAAMAFHAQRAHSTKTPSGAVADFITNGLPPTAGAPFADPCVDDNGAAIGNPRTIKAAVHQMDAILNKAGWHFPQSRLISLWEDVAAYQNGSRAPEPFFIRANSNDCIMFYHTNLVPNVYLQDDFQVFTPTDIIGQHIHLVKFDVMSADGSGNGWNYEDGTFSPDEVIERIHAINARGGLITDPGDETTPPTRQLLTARAHPYFGTLGAQTTVQRWWADPVLNVQGKDRTMRTVFTHDHYGPSTHQQVGLYASLLIEPAASTWRDPETGAIMGNRWDGGPTSWRADILMPNADDSYREFHFEFQDFNLAYTADNVPVNPPGRREANLPDIVLPPLAPMPEAVSADDPGTMTVNYRSEPLALRLRNPVTNSQASGDAGDPAFAYSSTVARMDPALNTQPTFYPPLTNGVGPMDPYTPLVRAYAGDNVQIRMQVGATEEGHNFQVHGVKWNRDPDMPHSDYVNSAMAGISEQFTFNVGHLAEIQGNNNTADYLYQPNSSTDGQWAGMWGIMRAYDGLRSDLLPLPSNPNGHVTRLNPDSRGDISQDQICPRAAPLREYNVSVVRAMDALPGGTLIYNEGAALHDPTALLYVMDSDLNPDGTLKATAPVEPLVLRATAGDCIHVTLNNKMTAAPANLDGWNFWPMIVNRFNANDIRPSEYVGLHAQLVQYDVRSDNGINVGNNKSAVVGIGKSKTYKWYAGAIEVRADGSVVATPIEYGASNLTSADTLKHTGKGLVGTLVVEPLGATWTYPVEGTRSTADITSRRGTFREFVMTWQDNLNLRHPDGSPLEPIRGEAEDSEDSGAAAINYRTEPMFTRLGYAPDTIVDVTNNQDLSGALSIAGTGPIETPMFSAPAGMPVRFRVMDAGGHPRNHVIAISGHLWRRDTGTAESDVTGAQEGHGPGGAWNLIPLHGAGGAMGVPGDYIYRDLGSNRFDDGLWGVFRVTQAPASPATP